MSERGMLTVEDVRVVVERMASESGRHPDDERLHMDEDDLWQEVLGAIAAGECEDPQAVAKEALRTTGLDFCRWYA